MSRGVRYVLAGVVLLTAAAVGWWWLQRPVSSLVLVVDLNGNPVPPDHSGLFRTVGLVVVLVVVIPGVRTGISVARRRWKRGRW